MNPTADLAKILYRHPDKSVRALPAKPLEFLNKQTEDTDTYFPETVQGNIVYTLPIKYAKRLLANQPERYFLMEPAVLAVKRMEGGGLTHKHVQVKADPSMLSKFFKEDTTEQQAADEKARALATEKAQDAAKKKQKDDEDVAAQKKLEDDAAALAALESAPLAESTHGRPPEL